MDLRPYVDTLRRELTVAVEAGGEYARALAERLIAPLESAIRLTLLDALSAAADEITCDLAPGSVDLRLRGLDPSFVVTPAPVDQPFEDAVETGVEEPNGVGPFAMGAKSASPLNEHEGATARINFRPPEYLKARIEAAASRQGLSVNAWLVRAVASTLKTDSCRSQRSPPDAGSATPPRCASHTLERIPVVHQWECLSSPSGGSGSQRVTK